MARFRRKRGHRPSGHLFSQVPTADIQRSTFDRSHCHKTTFNAGYLIPVYVDEVLPGDTFNMKMTAFARLATPIFPIMDNLYMDFFFFFVPNRLVWSHWQQFNGQQDNPGDTTEYKVPQVILDATVNAGTIFDYMGCVPGAYTTTKKTSVNSLYFRAYNLIWNEFFRDENLQNTVSAKKDDTDDTMGNYALLRRGKRHDYFTSALPWPQKGPGVELPLTGDAVVHGNANSSVTGIKLSETDTSTKLPLIDGTLTFADETKHASYTSAVSGAGTDKTMDRMWFSSINNVYADMSTVSATTINSLRQAFQLQKLMERDARGGTRYIEILKSHFGVTSPDSRLQRPEYLGGGQVPVNINQVLQTSATDKEISPQGNTAAYGTTSAHRVGFTKSFVEHGVIIGLASVRADLTYQQGHNRMLCNRNTRFDYYWPALSHIGEQAILNKEIFVTGDPADDDVFGYQERYAEYRYHPSRISGMFRSGGETLDAWHLAQAFSDRPALNDAFIQENPPMERILAVPSEPHFLFDSFFRLRCTRPMPVFGVPGLIDHF